MSVKAIKVLLVIVVSALIIKGLHFLIYQSFDLKMLYYKFLEPVMKY